MGQSDQARGEFVFSTDKSLLDLGVIHRYLSESSYWAQGRSRQAVATSVDQSLCFGVYAADGSQVGSARAVTDRATFAWLCDVFILEGYRGRGLGKELVETVMAHPEVRALPRVLLATRDAHRLYTSYGGFQNLPNPDWWMERIAPDPALPTVRPGAM
jgi:GNAT superfamily N-acetyltransferase